MYTKSAISEKCNIFFCSFGWLYVVVVAVATRQFSVDDDFITCNHSTIYEFHRSRMYLQLFVKGSLCTLMIGRVWQMRPINFRRWTQRFHSNISKAISLFFSRNRLFIYIAFDPKKKNLKKNITYRSSSAQYVKTTMNYSSPNLIKMLMKTKREIQECSPFD